MNEQDEFFGARTETDEVVTSMNDSFGELRSLFTAPVPDEQAIWSLLKQMDDADTQCYSEQVSEYLRPIMERLAASWDPRDYSPPELNEYERARPVLGVGFSRQRDFFRACALMPITLLGLRLGHPEPGDMTLKQLAREERLNRAYSIEFDGNWVTDSGVKALAKSKYVSNVVYLELTKTELGPEAALALSASDAFDELRHLALHYSFIGDNGVQALANSKHLPKLKHLALTQCWGTSEALTERSITALATSNRLRRLESLSLATNLCTLATLRPLLESSRFHRLRLLDLSNNHLGNEGVRLLSESSHFPNLEVLRLRRTYLGDVAALSLANTAMLSHLDMLDLRGETFSAAATNALREACVRHGVLLYL